MNLIHLLALDPATRYTGYAYFEQGLLDPLLRLTQYGVITSTRKEAFDLRCARLTSKIFDLFTEKECTNLVLEYPEFQAGTKGTHAARKGGTLQLAFLCGSICTSWQVHMARMLKDKGFNLALADLVTPSQWKGQLPKPVTAKRCTDKYGIRCDMKERSLNFTDAIMLGDFWTGENGLKVTKNPEAKQVDIAAGRK
jgi:hypothetical protein